MITEVRYRVRTNIPNRTKQNRQLGTDKQELEDQSGTGWERRNTGRNTKN